MITFNELLTIIPQYSTIKVLSHDLDANEQTRLYWQTWLKIDHHVYYANLEVVNIGHGCSMFWVVLK
jgi:hypothetical protein